METWSCLVRMLGESESARTEHPNREVVSSRLCVRARSVIHVESGIYGNRWQSYVNLWQSMAIYEGFGPFPFPFCPWGFPFSLQDLLDYSLQICVNLHDLEEVWWVWIWANLSKSGRVCIWICANLFESEWFLLNLNDSEQIWGSMYESEWISGRLSESEWDSVNPSALKWNRSTLNAIEQVWAKCNEPEHI